MTDIPKNAFIWTGSGYLDLLDPDPRRIKAREIATALSRQSRFNGLGTSRPYSVLQHSLVGLRVAKKMSDDRVFRARVLLHDAAEAYTGDLVRPLKRVLPGWDRIERGVNDAISAAFGVNISDMTPTIASIDRALMSAERIVLSPDSPASAEAWSMWRRRPGPEDVGGLSERVLGEAVDETQTMIDSFGDPDKCAREMLIEMENLKLIQR